MHEIWLTNDHGLRIRSLDDVIWLNASRVANAIGSCEGRFRTDLDPNIIKPDYMIQLWLAPLGGALFLWRTYFIRWWRFETIGGEDRLRIWGLGSNDLLRRRIVAAYAGSAQASKTGKADDMMKEIVSESIADGVAPTPDAGTRVWDDLSVAADLSAGPTLSKAFAFDRLLLPSRAGVLPEIAEAAREAGTEVFFDIVPDMVGSSSITFQFRTYINQPGMDVSDRVIFDTGQGNLEDPFVEYDYSEEINYVYAGGKGEGRARNIQQVYDSERYGISQWNRCEGFADARNQDSDNAVREAGRALLEEGRPVIRAGGKPLDTRASRFARDWDFGYKVRQRYKGLEFDAVIRSVVVRIDEGRRTVQARLDYRS